ncbi:hypothetical protein DAI22_03g283200 [Oryza sativa Japonica Group]|nr:hypothetical protein DAI22_03g283200 [Oryza sativa Japonica Group]
MTLIHSPNILSRTRDGDGQAGCDVRIRILCLLGASLFIQARKKRNCYITQMRCFLLLMDRHQADDDRNRRWSGPATLIATFNHQRGVEQCSSRDGPL